VEAATDIARLTPRRNQFSQLLGALVYAVALGSTIIGSLIATGHLDHHAGGEPQSPGTALVRARNSASAGLQIVSIGTCQQRWPPSGY
jgi:hypothetical protein